MNFTFGIITNGSNLISGVIDSIRSLKINNYEILIVGNCHKEISSDITYIQYTDISESGDISTKKNIITEKSRYENIVYLHDYVALNEDWYYGFLKYGNNFDVCMTKIINLDGSRYRDWCLWCDDANKYVSKNHYLIPYDITNLSSMMYISGAYFIAKKAFMLKNPLCDRLKWGQGEDVEWSMRARLSTNFAINTNSSARLLKYKERYFDETTEDENKILKQIINYDNSHSYTNLLKFHIGNYFN